ncbi:MAG: TolC family protein [Candidatus Aminicenantes bacterium]|jgi:outer membrane protein TolC
MKNKTLVCLIAFLTVATTPAWNGEEGTLSLSLEECILKALENNLRVAVEVINPDLAEMSITRAKEIFLPRFDLNFGARNTESPSYWFLEASGTSITKYSDYSLAVVQRIATGASLSLSLSGYKSDTNQLFQLINPRYGSTVQLNFSQPLLKDFGFKVNRREILIAQNNFDISQSQFEAVLMDTIYRAQEAYWNLVYAIESAKVTEQSLQLAQDLRAKNQKEVEVGKLAEIEVLNAEAVVASREADLLQAEALIERSGDALKNILNLLEAEAVAPRRIIPLDRPVFEKKTISLQEAIQTALNNQPDLRTREKTVETKELNLSVARNQLLPGLSLNVSYWSPGISGDRLIYLDDNPFLGVVIGKEERSGWNSLEDALKFLHNNWSIDLTLSVPISNYLTRANYVSAQMELEQSQLELKNTEKQVILDVRNAVRDIESSAKRYDALKVAARHAEKRLEAEEKKLSVGLSTNYFVLQYQEELASIKSQEIKALVDYNLALARLENVLGTSLEIRDIKIENFQ